MSVNSPDIAQFLEQSFFRASSDPDTDILLLLEFKLQIAGELIRKM